MASLPKSRPDRGTIVLVHPLALVRLGFWSILQEQWGDSVGIVLASSLRDLQGMHHAHPLFYADLVLIDAELPGAAEAFAWVDQHLGEARAALACVEMNPLVQRHAHGLHRGEVVDLSAPIGVLLGALESLLPGHGPLTSLSLDGLRRQSPLGGVSGLQA